jgi:hypothetical protein
MLSLHKEDACADAQPQYALIKYVMMIAHIYFVSNILFGKKERMKLWLIGE